MASPVWYILLYDNDKKDDKKESFFVIVIGYIRTFPGTYFSFFPPAARSPRNVAPFGRFVFLGTLHNLTSKSIPNEHSASPQTEIPLPSLGVRIKYELQHMYHDLAYRWLVGILISHLTPFGLLAAAHNGVYESMLYLHPYDCLVGVSHARVYRFRSRTMLSPASYAASSACRFRPCFRLVGR